MIKGISQTTQFNIAELALILANGAVLDIRATVEEINLFDNLFTPCVSGSVLVSDAVALSDQIKLQGGERIKIKIEKDVGVDTFNFEKEFVVYKIANRKNVNLSSQMYVIHFVSKEFILSEQKKISQNFTGSYSAIVGNILTNYLKVPNASPDPSNGLSGFGNIYETSGQQDIIIPNLTPFDAINFIAKRAIPVDTNTPDYVFYETAQQGYNFMPVTYLLGENNQSRCVINFKPKNLSGDNVEQEFYGARDLKILSQFSLIDTIRDGSYSGKFIGFDTLTKTVKISTIKTVYENVPEGYSPNLADAYNSEKKKYEDMNESRIVSYPFALPRTTVAHIKNNDPSAINFKDNTEEYVFQRKALFSNLMQRRLQLAMPGNFGLFSGIKVTLIVPRYSISDKNQAYDRNLSGEYLVTGVRHVIHFDKHETFIEVSTDKIEA